MRTTITYSRYQTDGTLIYKYAPTSVDTLFIDWYLIPKHVLLNRIQNIEHATTVTRLVIYTTPFSYMRMGMRLVDGVLADTHLQLAISPQSSKEKIQALRSLVIDELEICQEFISLGQQSRQQVIDFLTIRMNANLKLCLHLTEGSTQTITYQLACAL